VIVSPSRRKAPSWGAARSLTVAAVAVLAGPGLAGADEPAGGLDRIEEGRLRGWAADPARPGRALSVHVYVDGAYVGRAVAALPRSEAPGALGFSFALPERPAGRHEVTAFVLDPDGAPARLGPRTWWTGSHPVGRLEGLEGGVLRGWTFDPGRPDEPLRVHVYVDGPAGDGDYVGQARADVPRDDVAGRGFRFALPEALGRDLGRPLYAHAIDPEGGPSPLLPGSGLEVAAPGGAPPRGGVDEVDPEGVVRGWAHEPDHPDQPVLVHVYVDGPAGAGAYVGQALADRPRPEGPGRGFAFALPSALSAGRPRPIHVHAIDDAGGPNPLLPGSGLETTPRPTSLEAAGGAGQTVDAGLPLAEPLAVVVRGPTGDPLPGVAVSFEVVAGAGWLSDAVATTDAAGRAETHLTAGDAPGRLAVAASVAGLPPATFEATVTGLTYLDDVEPLLAARCYGCHGPGGVMHEITPLSAGYDDLLERTSYAAPAARLVVPFDPDGSVLVRNTREGGIMAGMLSRAEAAVLERWVAQGALRGVSRAPAELVRVSGSGQAAPPETRLLHPFVLRVLDAQGDPVAGASVSWRAGRGGVLEDAEARTDARGYARAWLVTGARRLSYAVASVEGLRRRRGFVARIRDGYVGAPLAGSDNPLDRAALAALRRAGVEPAGLCGDGEFLRRVTADVLGRLPTPEEVEAFLADDAPDKRERLVDRLLADGAFPYRWTREILGPWLELPAELDVAPEDGSRVRYAVDLLLASHLRERRPLGALVERLTGPGDLGQAFAARFNRFGGTEQADALVATFTGMTNRCARCHDHRLTGPADDPRWTQEQSYGLYAFFARSEGDAWPIDLEGRRRPGSGPQAPRFVLDGAAAPPAGLVRLDGARLPALDAPLPQRRAAFGVLLAESDAFARGTAHRIWAELAGPLLDPDDVRAATLEGVAAPELLAALADAFRTSGTRLDDFLRVCLTSRLYQLDARGRADADPLPARRVLRRHHAETLARGVRSLLGLPPAAPDDLVAAALGAPERGRAATTPRRDDLGLAQALALLNAPGGPGGLAGGSPRVAALAGDVAAGALTLEDAGARLVRAALARDPTDAERGAIRALAGAPPREVLEDLAAALAASPEYVLR